MRQKAYCCLFNTDNFCSITEWYAVVRFRPVPSTLGVVTNTEGLHESSNLRCISLRSSFPIAAYIWKISTSSATYYVIHHFKWRTSPRRGENCTALCGGGALGRAFLSLSCSGGECLSEWVVFVKFWDTLQVHSEALAEISISAIGKLANPPKYQVPILRIIVQKCQRDQLCLPTLTKNMHAAIDKPSMLPMHQVKCISPPGPACLLACSHFTQNQWGVHSTLVSALVVFRSVSFDCDHLLIVQGFPIWIIRCAACRWAASSSDQIECIKYFTANAMHLHHAVPSQYHALDCQAHLTTAKMPDNTSHWVNGIPV